MTEEERLIEKLRRIEALYARPGTAGEKDAAAEAMERIRERLRQVEKIDPPVEYKFIVPDTWSKQLLLALLQRYGVRAFKYPRQRPTTVMARISRKFVQETLWPEFQELHAQLRTYLDQVTQRVIAQALQTQLTEPEELDGP